MIEQKQNCTQLSDDSGACWMEWAIGVTKWETDEVVVRFIERKLKTTKPRQTTATSGLHNPHVPTVHIH